MQVSYFENGRYYAPSNLPRQWPMPAGAYDCEAGLRAFRGIRALALCRGARVRLGQRLRASLFAAHSDPVTADRRGLHRPARAQHQDRALGPDRAAEQPGTARRGNGDARQHGRGAADRRDAARHLERDDDLRPQPRGIARAHRRRDGTYPARLEGTGALWLAGTAFPLPHRLGVAKAAAAAAPADLRPRHQQGGQRLCGAPPDILRSGPRWPNRWLL